MRYHSTQVPRPSFEGRIEISELTGDIIETYKSYGKYILKITFSISTMLCCIAAVIGIVLGIWTLQAEWGKNQTEISITIGIINAIQIQVMNFLYTYLAVILNDFEGHRLEQDYYNNLVIKRIFFFIVNSFNSLFYIAFWKSGYGDNHAQRLQDVRTQLLTLFFTSIVIQNTFEIIIPLFCAKLITKIEFCQSKKFEKESRTGSAVRRNVLHNAARQQQAQAILHDSEEDLLQQKWRPLEVSDRLYDDIEEQLLKPQSPRVLDNTAEIVIQYGYIVLFFMVFPAMPLLGLINNFIEQRIDCYNLFNSRRPIPFASRGIGVWKNVISLASLVAVFTNVAMYSFRTDLLEKLINSTDSTHKALAYIIICAIVVIGMFIIRFLVPDESQTTLKYLQRQRVKFNFFLFC